MVFYPCIEILPYDQDGELDVALHAAATGQYDWIVLNDADTALVVGEHMRKAGFDPNQIPRRLKVATIGCMTETLHQGVHGPGFGLCARGLHA